MWLGQDKLSLFHSTGWILFISSGELMVNKQISYFCTIRPHNSCSERMKVSKECAKP